jgi:tetratricopeptide (TPR) repeat protein
MTFFRNIIISLIIFSITLILIYKPLTDNEIKQNLSYLSTTDRLLKESLTLRNIGLIEDAKEKIKEAIRRQPQYAISHYFLAEIYLEQGLIEKAIKEYYEVIKIDPEAYKSRVVLGELLYIKEKQKNSIELLKEAIQINPKNEEAYELLYSIYLDIGEEREAENLREKFNEKQKD